MTRAKHKTTKRSPKMIPFYGDKQCVITTVCRPRRYCSPTVSVGLTVPLRLWGKLKKCFCVSNGRGRSPPPHSTHVRHWMHYNYCLSCTQEIPINLFKFTTANKCTRNRGKPQPDRIYVRHSNYYNIISISGSLAYLNIQVFVVKQNSQLEASNNKNWTLQQIIKREWKVLMSHPIHNMSLTRHVIPGNWLHLYWHPNSYPWRELATCINYADLNTSMLYMRGHVSAGFFSLWRPILAR